MRRTAGLLSVLAVLLVGCGQAAEPEQAAPPPPPPVTSQPVAESFDLAAALAEIEAAGFTPMPPEGELAGPVRVIQAMCTGSANGRCQALFFFDGQRLAQQTGAFGMVSILSQDGTSVRVEFPVYNADDPGCCPTGTPTQHTIRLIGDQLRAAPPISTNPNRPGDS